jgi:hypothetical protein
MSYRDETAALAEQNRSLEQELAAKNREIVALRDAARAPSHVEPPRSSAIIARRERSLRVALLCAIAGLAVLTATVIASMILTLWPPWDVLLALAGATAVLLWLAAFAALLRGSYVIVPPGLALVFSTGRGHQVINAGHARMIVPLAMTTWVDVAARAARATIALRLRNDALVTFELLARTQPRDAAESVLQFVQRFGNGMGPARDEFVQSRIESAARSVLSQAEGPELDRDRIAYEERLKAELQSSLDGVGLELVDVSFTVQSIAVPSAPL